MSTIMLYSYVVYLTTGNEFAFTLKTKGKESAFILNIFIHRINDWLWVTSDTRKEVVLNLDAFVFSLLCK